MRKTLWILLSLAVVCGACTPAPAGQQKASSAMMRNDEMMKNDDDAMMNDEDSMMEYGGSYFTGITEAQLQDGSTKVLFFHAGWCPYCKAHDQALQGWYAADNAKLSTYKIDYDSSLELRSRYGVVQQDTFVLVDGSGNKLQELTGFPSDASIRTMIGSR